MYIRSQLRKIGKTYYVDYQENIIQPGMIPTPAPACRAREVVRLI
jgi:hypothetical protein